MSARTIAPERPAPSPTRRRRHRKAIAATLATAGVAAAGAAGIAFAGPAQAASTYFVVNNCYPGTFHALEMIGPNYAGWDFVPCGQGRSGVTAIISPSARVALCTVTFTNCVIYPQGVYLQLNYSHQAYTV